MVNCRSDWAEFSNNRLNDITTTPSPETTKSYITYTYSTSQDTTQRYNDRTHQSGNSLGNNNGRVYKNSVQNDDKLTYYGVGQVTHSHENNSLPYVQKRNNGSQEYGSQQTTQKTTTNINYFSTFSTTKSPYDFSDFGKTTSQQHSAHSNPNHQSEIKSSENYYPTSSTQSNLYNDYYKTTVQQNLYDEYYRTSTSKPNLYEDYYKTSTTKQNSYEEYYKTSTTKQHLYGEYYRTSTTEDPNIYAEYYRTSTAQPNSYDEYYRTSSQQHDSNNDNHFTPSTHPYNHVTHSTTENPYAAYELYYKTSTTTRPYYQSSGTSTLESIALAGSQSPNPSDPDPLHPQPPSAPLYHESSTKPGKSQIKVQNFDVLLSRILYKKGEIANT